MKILVINEVLVSSGLIGYYYLKQSGKPVKKLVATHNIYSCHTLYARAADSLKKFVVEFKTDMVFKLKR